jgi:two-component system, chemotaxis family, protein-glutamate methylesterase/glutaminase
MKKIEVLVVDDSSFFRNTFKKILENDEITVVGTAKDGKEAIEKTLELRPDIITMDIEMPVMDGIQSLSEIMKAYPTPVLMVSSQTSAGADATIHALNKGAIDFVTKKGGFGEMNGMKTEIQTKIHSICNNPNLSSIFERRRRIATMHVSKTSPSAATQTDEIEVINRLRIGRRFDSLAIGVSTGGPVALKQIFLSLKKGFDFPIFVTQHMPPEFTHSLAARLERECGHKIKEAEDGELVKGGTIYIAKGGKHLIISPTKKIKLSDDPSDILYKPSVDIMIDSVNNIYGDRSMAIIMTGMGQDGARGIRHLHENGGYVMVQSPKSCVVSGMVDSCLKNKSVDMICPLDKIADKLNKHFRL